MRVLKDMLSSCVIRLRQAGDDQLAFVDLRGCLTGWEGGMWKLPAVMLCHYFDSCRRRLQAVLSGGGSRVPGTLGLTSLDELRCRVQRSACNYLKTLHPVCPLFFLHPSAA